MLHTFHTLRKILYDNGYEYDSIDDYRFNNLKTSGIVYDLFEMPLKSYETLTELDKPYFKQIDKNGSIEIRSAEYLAYQYLSEGDSVTIVGCKKLQ